MTPSRVEPEFPEFLGQCRTYQNADDTQLYIAIHSNDDLARLEKCTSAVKDWFTENGMLLNPDKSEVLLVA